jgi:hypothetical protein
MSPATKRKTLIVGRYRKEARRAQIEMFSRLVDPSILKQIENSQSLDEMYYAKQKHKKRLSRMEEAMEIESEHLFTFFLCCVVYFQSEGNIFSAKEDQN